MRCFIALELDDSIKDRLETAQRLLKDVGGKINWTSRPQMHLTLKFLGEVAEEVVPQVTAVLQSAATETPVFDFILEGLGSFPPTGAPRVLWLGINPNETLKLLQQKIESGCADLGFAAEDRAFIPHLTLGRVKERPDVRLCQQIIADNKNFQAGTQTAQTIVLFSSQLKPTGSIYTQIANIQFKPM